MDAQFYKIRNPDIDLLKNNVHCVLQRFKLALQRGEVFFVGVLYDQRPYALDETQGLLGGFLERLEHELRDRLVSAGFSCRFQQLVISVFVLDDIGAGIQNREIQVPFVA